jgi:hypothetical protein
MNALVRRFAALVVRGHSPLSTESGRRRSTVVRLGTHNVVTTNQNFGDYPEKGSSKEYMSCVRF